MASYELRKASTDCLYSASPAGYLAIFFQTKGGKLTYTRAARSLHTVNYTPAYRWSLRIPAH